VTAYAEPDRERALKAGFSAYLSKPFRSEDLLDIVNQVLAKRAVTTNAAEAGSQQ
jgi:CheY-like chemotaxis protein